MVTIDNIKEATKKLQGMVEEFEKSQKEGGGDFLFECGDLVNFRSSKGNVCGVVLCPHVKGAFAGTSEYIVFLPNDYRGFSLPKLPGDIKIEFNDLSDKYGTFAYAVERDLKKIYRICGKN